MTSVTAAAICAVILVVPLIVLLAAVVVAFSIVGNVDIVVPVVPHEIEYLRQFKNLCAAIPSA